MDIDLILHSLRPGEYYGKLGAVIDQASYNLHIEWRDVTTKPPWAEIEAHRPITELLAAKVKARNVIMNEIILRTSRRLSISEIRTYFALSAGITVSNLTAEIQKDITIVNYGCVKADALDVESDLATVEAYDPKSDGAFPFAV